MTGSLKPRFQLLAAMMMMMMMMTLAACGGGSGGGAGGGGAPPVSYSVTATAGSGGTITPTSVAVPAGGIATFTLAAAPGYRIAGASGCGGVLNSATFTTAPVSGDCTVSTTFALDGATRQTGYTSFDGKVLTLFAWEGQRVALLSARADLDKATMARWLDGLDKGYAFYAATAPRLPTEDRIVDGRLPFAQVPTTCGAGCGLLGATGIELLSSYFDTIYETLRTTGKFDQAPFYELGRNFWFYSPQLGYRSPDTPDAVVTGFAVFMRFEAMAAAGVPGADFNGRSFAQFQSEVEALIDQYLADPSKTWSNTIRVNQGLPGPYGATDLFASFTMRLKRDYGGDAFVAALWKEAAKRPLATTTQDAVDNFILAASAAARKNLTGQFERWRWPVSDAARSEAGSRFGLPV